MVIGWAGHILLNLTFLSIGTFIVFWLWLRRQNKPKNTSKKGE